MPWIWIGLCLAMAAVGADSGVASFIKPCHASDNACVVASAQEAIPVVAAGVPALGIEPLDPMHLDLITSKRSGLELEFTDTTVRGMKTCTVDSIKLDLMKRKQVVQMRCTVALRGKYKMGGRLIVLPIQGQGEYAIDIKDIVIKTNLELKTVQGDDGKPHWQIGKWRHNSNVEGGADFNFQNMFNGNSLLADPVHQFLNSNWREVMSEIAPPVVRAIVSRVVAAVSRMYDHVPIDELSLD